MSDLIGIFSNGIFFEQLAARWMFLVLLGLAFAITYRVRYVNLGISAQLIAGAYSACSITSIFPYWYVALTAAFLAVSVVGWLPAHLKSKFQANEILSTLFLTYVVISLGQLIMRPSGGELIVASPQVVASAIPDWLIPFDRASSMSWFHLLAIPSVFLYSLLPYLVFGYKVRVAGSNPSALKDKVVTNLLLFSTLLSSLFITLALMGDTYVMKARYVSHEYDTTGFLGIAVALVAIGLEGFVGKFIKDKNLGIKSCLGSLPILFAAFFVAFVEVVFRYMSVIYSIPARMAFVVFGVSLMLAALALKRE